jgi:hypothetical protein
VGRIRTCEPCHGALGGSVEVFFARLYVLSHMRCIFNFANMNRVAWLQRGTTCCGEFGAGMAAGGKVG